MNIASPFTTADLAVAIRAEVVGDVVTSDEPSFPAATFGFTGTAGRDLELVVIAGRRGGRRRGDPGRRAGRAAGERADTGGHRR